MNDAIDALEKEIKEIKEKKNLELEQTNAEYQVIIVATENEKKITKFQVITYLKLFFIKLYILFI